MNDMLQAILAGFDEVNKIYNRLSLYEKKRERMGLTDEEAEELKEMQVKYFVRCEEIISEIVTVFIDKVMTEEGEKALKKIQEHIPWSGKIIIHSNEIDAIMDAVGQLDEKTMRKMRVSLKKLHAEIFTSINEACKQSDILESFDRLGLVVTNGREDSDIMDSLSYIDSIYREFGEIIGVKLRNVTVTEDYE